MTTTERRTKREARIWDQLAARYEEDQEAYIDTLYKEIIERATESLKKDDTVLEIGCGTGLVTFGVAARVKRVLAYDISPKMLEVARNKAVQKGTTNIEFEVGDDPRT